MYKPCLEAPNKRRKEFDKTLCIVCQLKVETSKRGRPKKADDEHFKVFNEVFKILEDRGDKTYHFIYDITKSKSHVELANENFCFHSVPCRRDFQRILANHERMQVSDESTSKRPISVSKVSRGETKTFVKELCFI